MWSSPRVEFLKHLWIMVRTLISVMSWFYVGKVSWTGVEIYVFLNSVGKSATHSSISNFPRFCRKITFWYKRVCENLLFRAKLLHSLRSCRKHRIQHWIFTLPLLYRNILFLTDAIHGLKILWLDATQTLKNPMGRNVLSVYFYSSAITYYFFQNCSLLHIISF